MLSEKKMKQFYRQANPSPVRPEGKTPPVFGGHINSPAIRPIA
jgi:hypothetical protein